MLTALKFVQGAVSSKTLVPAMSHFVIEHGKVRSYNGRMALCSPIPFNIDCKPKANQLVSAIGKCEETVTLSLSQAGRLKIQSGKFKAFVDCIEGDVPHLEPRGELIELGSVPILGALRSLFAFVGDDATRPWCGGILLRDQSAFATNNVCLVEWWLGAKFPVEVNIPADAIREMIRIGEEPEAMQITDSNVTFHYPDGRWILTNLLATQWPDLTRVLNRDPASKPKKMDERIFEGLDVLKPFVDDFGRIFFTEQSMRTHPDGQAGACFDLPGFEAQGCYRLEMLSKLKGIAERIDFTAYPAPCLFFGKQVRGAIIGMRQLP